MREAPRILVCVLAAALLGGCANIPDVTIRYYPVKWSASLSVTQTVACNRTGTHLTWLMMPAVTTTYSSDRDKGPFTLRIKDLDGGYADLELTVGLTEDGRLKSINQRSEGQGEAIVKSTIALAATLDTLRGRSAAPQAAAATASAVDVAAAARPGLSQRALAEAAIAAAPGEPIVNACRVVADWGDGKPVALIYRQSFDREKFGQTLELKAAKESAMLYDQIKDQLPKLFTKIEEERKEEKKSGEPIYTPLPGDVLVSLQKLTSAKIDLLSSSESQTEPPIATLRITIPKQETYKLPIPKTALFGKQAFQLQLSDAGAVLVLGYSKTAGAAAALGSVREVIAGREGAAAKAAELKAESDLLYEQQRHHTCLTQPDKCPK